MTSISERILLATVGLALGLVVVDPSASATEEIFLSDPVKLDSIIGFLEIARQESPNNTALLTAKAMTELRLLRAGNRPEQPSGMVSKLTKLINQDLARLDHLGDPKGMASYLRAVLALEEGRGHEAAETHLEAAIEKGLNTAYVKEQLAVLYLADGRHIEVVELLRPAASKSVSAQTHHLLAIAYLGEGDLASGLEESRASVRLGGGMQSELVMASALSLSGQYDESASVLRSILRSDEKNKSALMGLLAVLKKAGDDSEAATVRASLIDYYGDDPDVRSFLEQPVSE